MWWLAIPLATAAPSGPAPTPPLAVDRVWESLPAPGADLRSAYRRAGELLGDWQIRVAEVPIDGARLSAVAAAAPGEPFTRALREDLRRPVDPLDLLYLIDDVLAAADRRGEPLVVTPSRARDLGVLIHPEEIFKKGVVKPYPVKAEVVAVDEPPPQDAFPVAVDGEVLGPNWTMRYRPPTDRASLFRALSEKRPDYARRVLSLIEQLEAQGCDVALTSFVRYPERGYLMWGSFELKRAPIEDQPAVLARLAAANEKWGHVPITWAAPDGPEATREAARRMADVYGVVYATETGARTSRHYDGKAADFVALGLPRALTLTAPDGATRTFDLSGADEPRDLSLTPAVIAWIEEHFEMWKLRTDHPHWEDAREDP